MAVAATALAGFEKKGRAQFGWSFWQAALQAAALIASLDEWTSD